MDSINRRHALTLGAGALLGAAGATAFDTEAANATAGWQRLVVVTANIGRNAERPGTRNVAIKRVRHAVNGAQPLVGWQEIFEGNENAKEIRWINHWFGPRFRNIFEQQSGTRRVPMSIPRTFEIVDRTHTFVHEGKGGVTPHRIITQAVLAHKDDPALRFVFVNTHYVAGAFNGRQDQHERWRKEMWRRHRKAHHDVLQHWRSRGFPVIWTGDVNRNPMPLLLPNHEHRVFARGIDQIGWVPGTNGTQIRLHRRKVVGMNVDQHNARVAVFQIRRQG